MVAGTSQASKSLIVYSMRSQALAASCFDESEHNNVDSVVVPVLCNLAACSINLEVSSYPLRESDWR